MAGGVQEHELRRAVQRVVVIVELRGYLLRTCPLSHGGSVANSRVVADSRVVAYGRVVSCGRVVVYSRVVTVT